MSAGGKANIKLWKIFHHLDSNGSMAVEKITHLYEFKRFRAKKYSPKTEKPWLYIDLKSNPDMRFMDVKIFRSNDDFIICFACSDGFVRIFRYILTTNKIDLINKYPYPKCLLCLQYFKLDNEMTYLIGFGTDGCLLFWRLNLENEESPQKLPNLHQSGVNCFDILKFKSEKNDRRFLLATIGDDTRINVLEITVDENNCFRLVSEPIKLDMAHASSITGYFQLITQIYSNPVHPLFFI